MCWTSGGGGYPLPTLGNFLEFGGGGGTKTMRLWVHYKVKININSSSQYIYDCSTRGGRGPLLLTPRGRVWEGASPSHGRDLSKGKGRISFLRFGPSTISGAICKCLILSEIVPRNVYNCMRFKGLWRRVVGYVIIFLDIRVWEGDTASQMHYKVKFHTQKSRILQKAQKLLPEFQTSLTVYTVLFGQEAVSKIWAKPK